MVRNEQLLKDIILKMSYDVAKTLSENIKEQADVTGVMNKLIHDSKISGDITRDILPDTIQEEEREGNVQGGTIYPIPDYTTYYIPPIMGFKSGGKQYMYFPNGSQMTFWDRMALPEDFKRTEEFNEYVKKNNESENTRPTMDYITAENLAKVFTVGDVRSFVSGLDGLEYHGWIRMGTNTDYHWYFIGYFTRDGKPYKQPDPEDYKTWWEKFVEKWGTIFQIVASVVVAAAIGYFTGGLGMSLALRIGLEILGELAINIPVSIAERSLGDDAAANLSIAFSFLPLLSAGTLRALGWMKSVPKEVAEQLSKDLAATSIKTGEDLAKFYDNLPTDGPERYVFSQMLKQQPEAFESAVRNTVSDAMSDGTFKSGVLERLLWKDRDWWKDAGMQMGAGLTLVIAKSLTTNTYSEEQYQRMNSLLMEIAKEYGDEHAQALTEHLVENPQDTAKLMNVFVADTTTREGKQKVIESADMVKEVLKNNGVPIKFGESRGLIYRAIMDSVANAQKSQFDPSLLNNPEENNDGDSTEGNNQTN